MADSIVVEEVDNTAPVEVAEVVDSMIAAVSDRTFVVVVVVDRMLVVEFGMDYMSSMDRTQYNLMDHNQ